MYKNLKIILCSVVVVLAASAVVFAEGCLLNNNSYNKVIKLDNAGNVTYKQYEGFYKPLNSYLDMEIVDINLNAKDINVTPALLDELSTVDSAAIKNNAIAAINTGFFDFNNGKSVSFVYTDGKMIANPKDNTNLTSNKNIQPYLEDIYNRAELKKLNCDGKMVYKIGFHNDKYSKCQLVDLMQGGPMLRPEMNLDKESFLVFKDGKKVRESANVSNKDARVVVALTPDNHMLWIVVSAGYKDSKYYGLTIKELASLIKNFKVKSALAYDGGSSASLYVKMPDGKDHFTIGDITKDGKRIKAHVKSVLLLKEKLNDQ